jgi:hypothetical protein
VISSANSSFLAFSLKFSAVRSSSCVFKDVLSAAACVAIPDHLGRSELQIKKQGYNQRMKLEGQSSTHVVCPRVARTIFGFLLPRRGSSYKPSIGP